MNRHDRRQQAKHQNRVNREKELLENWVSSLSPVKLKLLDTVLNKRIDMNNKAIATGVSAVLINDYGFTIEEIEKFVAKSNVYIEETKNYLESQGEDYMKKAIQNKSKVDKRIKELIEGGAKKSEGIKTLVKEFGITNAIASIEWTEVKEKNPKLQVNVVKNGLKQDVKVKKKETVRKDDKIIIDEDNLTVKNGELSINDSNGEKVLNIDSEDNMKVNGKLEETPTALIPDVEEKPEEYPLTPEKIGTIKVSEADNKFVTFVAPDLVIDELKGTYKGINFVKNSDGVQVGEEHFKDLDELGKYVTNEINKFKERAATIAEIFNIGA